MAYTKTTWANDVAVTSARLNNMETQYDEALAEAVNVRKDSTKELRAEVVATLTGETPTAGRLVHNTDNGFFYGGNGSAWGLIGGGINIKSYQRFVYYWEGTTIAALRSEVSLTLTTAVSDYTKCICLVKGDYPYNLGFKYFAQSVPTQEVRMPFYAYLTDNSTLKLVPSFTEPDVTNENISNVVQTVLSAAYREQTAVEIEIIEIDGAKNILFAQKIDANATSYYTGVTGITGITDYTKTLVFFEGGFALSSYNSGNPLVEYKRFTAKMASNTGFNMYKYGAKIGTGGGIFGQHRKAAYYILETF